MINDADFAWKWAIYLLFIGGILFWIGAFTPPYKQWMTRDTGEYLSIIHSHKINWFVIHGFFALGVIISFLGFNALSTLFQTGEKTKLLINVANAGYILGSGFWILNIAFRLTVTWWAAGEYAINNTVPFAFKTWMDWSNLIFAVYMVLAYLAIGLSGYLFMDIQWIPAWVSWFFMIFGFGGMVGYLVRIPLWDPPLMVHLPFLILGVVYFIKK